MGSSNRSQKRRDAENECIEFFTATGTIKYIFKPFLGDYPMKKILFCLAIFMLAHISFPARGMQMTELEKTQDVKCMKNLISGETARYDEYITQACAYCKRKEFDEKQQWCTLFIPVLKELSPADTDGAKKIAYIADALLNMSNHLSQETRLQFTTYFREHAVLLAIPQISRLNVHLANKPELKRSSSLLLIRKAMQDTSRRSLDEERLKAPASVDQQAPGQSAGATLGAACSLSSQSVPLQGGLNAQRSDSYEAALDQRLRRLENSLDLIITKLEKTRETEQKVNKLIIAMATDHAPSWLRKGKEKFQDGKFAAAFEYFNLAALQDVHPAIKKEAQEYLARREFKAPVDSTPISSVTPGDGDKACPSCTLL